MSSSPDRCPFCNGISSHVYVGNLKDDVTNVELKAIFDVYGPIKKTWIARNPKARGFGFVSFFNYSDAKRAVEDMDGRCIFGSYIKVEISRNKTLEEWYGKNSSIPPLLGEDISSATHNRHSSSPSSTSRSKSPTRSRSSATHNRHSSSPTSTSRSKSPTRSRSSANRHRSRSPTHSRRHKPRKNKRRSPSQSLLFDDETYHGRRRSPSPVLRPNLGEQGPIYPYSSAPIQEAIDPGPFLPNGMTPAFPPPALIGYPNFATLQQNTLAMDNMMPFMPYPNRLQTQYNQHPTNYEETKPGNNLMMPYQNTGTMPNEVQNACTRPSITFPIPYATMSPAQQLSSTRIPTAVSPPRFPLPVSKPKIPPPPLPPPPPPPQSRERFASTTAPVRLGMNKFNSTTRSQEGQSTTYRPL